MSDKSPTDHARVKAAWRPRLAIRSPWRDPDFLDEGSLFKELERVFDICHGCRRCFSLCNSFPTLFDAVDAGETGEVDGVDRKVDYWDVVDHCYLCDMCYMTKCPYVPPHPWNVDFPHLMLRAKALKFEEGRTRVRDRILSATDAVGRLAGIPVVVQMVNAVNASGAGRKLARCERSACTPRRPCRATTARPTASVMRAVRSPRSRSSRPIRTRGTRGALRHLLRQSQRA